MKTIKQWFNEIEDDKIREKAINNTDKDTLEATGTSLHYAINWAFVWDKSPEGHDYWERIAEGYRHHGAEESQAITE